jgi:hypothetical protein
MVCSPFFSIVLTRFRRASWQRQTVKSKALSEAEVRERPSKDPSIVCPIDNRILRDAVKTPCCGTAYCEDCIQTHLLDKDFICPLCGTKVASLDKLAIDRPMRRKVADYIAKEVEASQREEEGQITNESTPVGSVSQVTDSLFLSTPFSPFISLSRIYGTHLRPRRLPFPKTSSLACTHKKTCPPTWPCRR